MEIKIKRPNSSQEPQAPTKAPNQDLKDMDILCNFKIKIKSHNMDVTKTSDHIQIQDQDVNSQLETYSILKSPKSGLKRHKYYLALQN